MAAVLNITSHIRFLLGCLDNHMCKQPRGSSKNAATMAVLHHDLINQQLDLIILGHI